MRVFVTIFEQLVPISGGGTPRISSIVDVLVNRGHEVSVAASLAVDVKDALTVLRCDRVFPLKNVSRLDKNKMAKYLLFHPFNISKVMYGASRIKPDFLLPKPGLRKTRAWNRFSGGLKLKTEAFFWTARQLES